MFVIYYSLWFSIVGLLLKSCSLLNFTHCLRKIIVSPLFFLLVYLYHLITVFEVSLLFFS